MERYRIYSGPHLMSCAGTAQAVGDYIMAQSPHSEDTTPARWWSLDTAPGVAYPYTVYHWAGRALVGTPQAGQIYPALKFANVCNRGGH